MQQAQVAALIVQGRRLGHHHIDVRDQPGLVLVLGQTQRLTGRIQCLLTHDRFVLQHLELNQVIFHFTETVEHRLAVLGHGFIVGRFAAVHFRRTLATVEQGHGQLRADRPEAVRQADPIGVRAAAVTAIQAQRQVRVIGRLGHTDVGVGSHDRTLGGGNVRASFKQLRRQAQWHLRQCRDAVDFHQTELGGRQTDEYGNGVFELGTLPDQIDHVCLGTLELRLRLSHRVLAGNPGAVLVLGHFQRTLIGLDGRFQQTFLLIDHAQLQVVLHQFRLLAQAHRRQIGKTGLGVGGVGFQATAQFAPDIRFPTHARLGGVGVANAAGRTGQAGIAAAGALA